MLRKLLAAVALAFLTAAPATAQTDPPPSFGGISGMVLDATTGLPLAGALVALGSEGAGVLATSGDGAFMSAGQATLSSAEGSYRFRPLPPGRYRIRISRVGYRSATLALELRGAADSHLSIGLTVEPVALEPVEVEGVPTESYGRTVQAEDEIDGSRVSAARARQRTYLGSDVRSLTHADVLESVTLGETDLFRALQRAPGVAAGDDYRAGFWVRGASWDRTRVYFDGVPLFNPVHGFGLLSAVNTDATGGAILHPGVRPASIGDGAAAVLQVSTRQAGANTGDIDALANLSLASGRLALDGRSESGRVAWMLAGRRSWIDLASRAVGAHLDDPEIAVPYAFSDVTGRLDIELDHGRKLEASAIHERDRIYGTVPDIIHRTRSGWGNSAARVTLASPFRDLASRSTVAFSRYSSDTHTADPDPEAEGGMSAGGADASQNRLAHLSISGEVTPSSGIGKARWRAGYELIHQSVDYDGPAPYIFDRYSITGPDSLTQNRATNQRLALWGEHRWDGIRGLRVESGLRLEMGPKISNGGVLRAAPRILARYTASPDLLLSAGIGRSYQYTQALSGTGPIVVEGFAASPFWLLADEQSPAIRADIATLGAELWLGPNWLLGATSYFRHSTGIVLADPTPGYLLAGRATVAAENDAGGVEISARRLAGRWTASAAYTLATSTMDGAGMSFPAAEDRRHTLDLTSMLRFGRNVRLGAAFTHASGSPFTRFHEERVCDDTRCQTALRVEAPNARRSPDYASLDLLFDWTARFRTWDLGLYLQLRNALHHRNDVTFDNVTASCDGSWSPEFGCEGTLSARDEYLRGLPRIPVIGFRARF